MTTPSLGDIIATRVFSSRRDDGGEHSVTVEIGRPIFLDQEREWWCPIRIRGLGSEEVQGIAGEDSLQALLLAIRYVDGMLPYEAERKNETISWLGSDDLGLSTSR